MEQTLFCKTFSFQTIRLNSFRHTDNSKGIPCHFVARMNNGSGIIRAISGEELHLRAGDIFYLPMGLQYHSYWTTDDTGDRMVAWESYGFTHLPVPSETRYAMQKIYPSGEAVQWLDRLERDQTVSPASVGYLYLFLSDVLPGLRVSECNPKEALFQIAFDYIWRHESFSVPELAQACGMSESGLYAFFRNYANTTPIEIKHRLIAERAVALLTTTDQTVETIASSLGLCSSAYLRRILKKQTGCTPSQVRKEAKFM
jgi:AraC-like DNA-binding protein